MAFSWQSPSLLRHDEIEVADTTLRSMRRCMYQVSRTMISECTIVGSVYDAFYACSSESGYIRLS